MRALLLVLLILGGGQARAADPVLAPSGTLRAAYIVANLAQARLDPATGTVTGVIADITREMGRRAGVPVAISPLPTASDVLQAVRSGAADIGFVAPNPERTGVVLYSQTYMLVQQGALVRADSALRSVRELDRPGHVIGVNTDDSVGVCCRNDSPPRACARHPIIRFTTLCDGCKMARWWRSPAADSVSPPRPETFRACGSWTTISTACRSRSPCRPTARTAWRWSTRRSMSSARAASWPTPSRAAGSTDLL
jgi:hypothetical protein